VVGHELHADDGGEPDAPLESTTVRPAARIRIGAASSRIERMLSNVPNTAGSAIQKAATMMAKPTRVA
jgi:hypothetical protein